MVAKADEGATGNFEVVLEQTGTLVHSKTTRGQGRCEDAKETQGVIDAVKEYLDGVDN